MSRSVFTNLKGDKIGDRWRKVLGSHATPCLTVDKPGIRIGNARSFHPIGDWNRQQGRENGSRRLETGSSRCQKNNRESP